jgi:hypothetical protein
MSESTDLIIRSGQTVVAAAGTRVILLAGDPQNIRVKSVNIRALSTNGGIIYVGGSDVSNLVGRELIANENVTIQVSDEDWKHGSSVNLSKIWLDASVNGEGVSYIYVR